MRSIEKPWGFEKIHYAGKYVVKEIFIKKGHRLSLQYHKQKTETLILFSGIVRIITDSDSEVLVSGYIKHIEPGVVHRMEAWEDAVLFECSTPELEDVVRLEDDYGR